MKNKNVGIESTIPVAEFYITSNTKAVNIIKTEEKNTKTNEEKMIFDIVAANRSKSQKGDLSEFVKDLLSPQQISTLRKRDKDKMTGNPIDIKRLIT